jgi:hypothetical protein
MSAIINLADASSTQCIRCGNGGARGPVAGRQRSRPAPEIDGLCGSPRGAHAAQVFFAKRANRGDRA